MKKLFLLCITVLSCASILAQNAVNLKLNLEKNKTYRLKSVSEQAVTQTINGVAQTTESKVDYSLSLKMVDATSDFIVTEIYFDTLINSTNTMGKLVNSNSLSEGDIKSTEVADVLTCIMNRLSRNAVYVKMDFAGRATEIVNSKMLSDIILKDTSLITLAGPTGAALKSQVLNLVSDNNLKTIIELFTYRLPGRQVSIGDKWDVIQKISSGGMMLDIMTSYQLNGLNGNNANINAESTIKAADNAAPIESGGAKVTYDDLIGLSKSTMVIDIRTGLVVEDKSKIHITGNLGISAPGFSMQMPMDINGESAVIGLK